MKKPLCHALPGPGLKTGSFARGSTRRIGSDPEPGRRWRSGLPHLSLPGLVRPAIAILLVCVAAVWWPTLSVAFAADAVLPADRAYQAAQAGLLTLIDVRTPAEWRETGVPVGAIRADLKDPGGPAVFVATVTADLKGDKTAAVAVICRSGRRSTEARQILLDAGFSAVSNVREGMAGNPTDGPGWLARHLPLSAQP